MNPPPCTVHFLQVDLVETYGKWTAMSRTYPVRDVCLRIYPLCLSLLFLFTSPFPLHSFLFLFYIALFKACVDLCPGYAGVLAYLCSTTRCAVVLDQGGRLWMHQNEAILVLLCVLVCHPRLPSPPLSDLCLLILIITLSSH